MQPVLHWSRAGGRALQMDKAGLRALSHTSGVVADLLALLRVARGVPLPGLLLSLSCLAPVTLGAELGVCLGAVGGREPLRRFLPHASDMPKGPQERSLNTKLLLINPKGFCCTGVGS
jgi:hypothetical protein